LIFIAIFFLLPIPPRGKVSALNKNANNGLMVNWSNTWTYLFGRIAIGILLIFSSLRLDGQPPNDLCTGADPLLVSQTGNCQFISGNTTGYNFTYPFSCAYSGSEEYVDVWYLFQAPLSTLTFHSGTGNPYAVIYDGTDCFALNPISEGCLRGSGTITGLVPGQSYLMQVLTHGTGGSAYDFCLEAASSPPLNNTCSNAIQITLGNPINFDAQYATVEQLPSCVPFPSLNLPDLWYTFIGPPEGEVNFSNSTGNVFLSIYEGTCGSLTLLSCAIPISTPPTNLNPGQTYFAQISFAGTENSTQETITAPGSFSFTAANSNDWSDGSNWLAGNPPDGITDVTIPAGVTCNMDENFSLNAILTLEAGATLALDETLTLNGTLTNNGNLSLNGTLKGNGTLQQSGTFTSSGTIAPGLSPGGLDITGNYDMGGTTYNCEINGSIPESDYDVINVSGTATLTGGTLNVTWGFTPADGQTFTILNAGTRSGIFTSTNIAPLPGRVFTTNYLPNGVEILAEATLPVELTNFEGKAIDEGKVLLFWETATELDNRGFEIQKMEDNGNWKVLSFVEGQGTSFLANQYSFIDEHPSSGFNYYRLRQIDLDGTDWISPIVSVKVDEGVKAFSLYPNPNNGIFQLRTNKEILGEAQITITNLAQQKVLEKRWSPENISEKLDIDISGFSSGTYFLRLEQAHGTFVERILVQTGKQ
jgi:hypothetical protein